MSKAHVSNNSGTIEWYTPGKIVEAVRATLGAIDLDPASCSEANKLIRARQFYSTDDDGLTKRSTGRVFMNPPYAGGMIGQFIRKLIEHYRAADITEAVVLVNNATETDWCQRLMAAASAMCLITGRLRFWRPDTEGGTPLQGQIAFYLGSRPELFRQMFRAFGTVWSHAKRHETKGELFGNPEGRPASFGRPMTAAERQRRARMKRKAAAGIE